MAIPSPAASSGDATPWTRNYPPGMRWDADLPVKPVQQMLDEAVARWPDQLGRRVHGPVPRPTASSARRSTAPSWR